MSDGLTVCELLNQSVSEKTQVHLYGTLWNTSITIYCHYNG